MSNSFFFHSLYIPKSKFKLLYYSDNYLEWNITQVWKLLFHFNSVILDAFIPNMENIKRW